MAKAYCVCKNTSSDYQGLFGAGKVRGIDTVLWVPTCCRRPTREVWESWITCCQECLRSFSNPYEDICRSCFQELQSELQYKSYAWARKQPEPWESLINKVT